MIHLGDFNKGDTIYVPWNTAGANGASITRATNGTVAVWKNGDLTQFTTGVTDEEDWDAAPYTGMHVVTIATTDAAYTVNGFYLVGTTAETIDGVTVNAWLASFTLNRKHATQSLAGLLQTVDSTTIIELPTAAVATDDYYNGQMVSVLYGTGAGQSRMIDDYVGSTQKATVSPAFTTLLDTTSVVEVTMTAPASTGLPMPANVTQLLGTAWLTPAVAGTPDVNTKTLHSTPRAEIATAVNDEAIQRLDGYTADDDDLTIDGTAHTITRHADGYITSITQD